VLFERSGNVDLNGEKMKHMTILEWKVPENGHFPDGRACLSTILRRIWKGIWGMVLILALLVSGV